MWTAARELVTTTHDSESTEVSDFSDSTALAYSHIRRTTKRYQSNIQLGRQHAGRVRQCHRAPGQTNQIQQQVPGRLQDVQIEEGQGVSLPSSPRASRLDQALFSTSC